MQHLWMLLDVVFVWQGSFINVAPGLLANSKFRTFSKRCRSNNAIVLPGLSIAGPAMSRLCCVEMLRSFGRGLKQYPTRTSGRVSTSLMALKPRQTIATCHRNIVRSDMLHVLRAFGHRVGMYCDMLGVVGSSLKIR